MPKRVNAIFQDSKGHMWFGNNGNGLMHFDGKKMTNFTTKDGLPSNAVNTIYKSKNGELWFGTDGAGVCKFNGEKIIRL